MLRLGDGEQSLEPRNPHLTRPCHLGVSILEEMMKYHDQLKHPLWQKKRLEVMEANGFECQNCGSKEEQLNVHHPFYKRGAMVWDYSVEELRCLCNVCHKNVHALDENVAQAIGLLDFTSKMRLLGYIKHVSAMQSDDVTLNDVEEIEGFLDACNIPTDIMGAEKAIMEKNGIVNSSTFSNLRTLRRVLRKFLHENTETLVVLYDHEKQQTEG